MWRCVILDDSAVFRESARQLLEGQGVTVVGMAATTAGATRLIDEQDPDVVLVDIDLGPESGLAFVGGLAEELQKRCILISTRDESDYGDLVASSPAAGFVSKSNLSVLVIDELLRQG